MYALELTVEQAQHYADVAGDLKGDGSLDSDARERLGELELEYRSLGKHASKNDTGKAIGELRNELVPLHELVGSIVWKEGG